MGPGHLMAAIRERRKKEMKKERKESEEIPTVLMI